MANPQNLQPIPFYEEWKKKGVEREKYKCAVNGLFHPRTFMPAPPESPNVDEKREHNQTYFFKRYFHCKYPPHDTSDDPSSVDGKLFKIEQLLQDRHDQFWLNQEDKLKVTNSKILEQVFELEFTLDYLQTDADREEKKALYTTQRMVNIEFALACNCQWNHPCEWKKLHNIVDERLGSGKRSRAQKAKRQVVTVLAWRPDPLNYKWDDNAT
ncbi:MAG: hypothetical protein Q9219_006254 [cf. Caloplaca sp. 3 TL-2023]